MAISGPAPNPNRRRTNTDTYQAFKVIYPDDKIRGPELPETRDWPSQTLEWWEEWRRAPQAQLMTSTDWRMMLVAAELHAKIYDPLMAWKGGDLAALSRELDRKLSGYGQSYNDRLKLRFVIKGLDDIAEDLEQKYEDQAKASLYSDMFEEE